MEPERRLHELVQKSDDKIVFDKNIPIKRYFRSGKEILRMANVYKSEGDDERAFQLFMRYITLFLEKMVQHPEFKEADPLEKALVKRNCKEIFPITESLKANIKKRYDAQYRIHLEEEKVRLEEEERRRANESKLRERQEEIEKDMEEEQLLNKFKEAQFRIANQIERDTRLQDDRDEVDRVIPPEPAGATLPPPYSLTDQRPAPWATPSAPSVPQVDRSTKPFSTIGDFESRDGLRRVVVPSDLTAQFLHAAELNTVCNIETCGLLAGKLSQNVFTITHVLVPKQKGTSDSCQTQNEEEIFDFQDEHDLMTLGWIHTHPSQSAFMSSIDLHTHCSYQLMLSEAIAIVCAPKFDQVGLYMLTPDHGLRFIANCRESGFHPHPKEPPLYQDCGHVSFDSSKLLTLVDLR